MKVLVSVILAIALVGCAANVGHVRERQVSNEGALEHGPHYDCEVYGFSFAIGDGEACQASGNGWPWE